jgi:hypothetical protein
MIVVLLIRFKESMYIQYSAVLYKNSPSIRYKIELNGMTQLMCIHILGISNGWYVRSCLSGYLQIVV